MADHPTEPSPGGGAGVAPGGEPDVGATRWAKLLGLVALALILLSVILHLAYGDLGNHAP